MSGENVCRKIPRGQNAYFLFNLTAGDFTMILVAKAAAMIPISSAATVPGFWLEWRGNLHLRWKVEVLN